MISGAWAWLELVNVPCQLRQSGSEDTPLSCSSLNATTPPPRPRRLATAVGSRFIQMSMECFLRQGMAWHVRTVTAGHHT